MAEKARRQAQEEGRRGRDHAHHAHDAQTSRGIVERWLALLGDQGPDRRAPEAVEAQMQGQIKKGEYFSLFKNGQWSMSKADKVMPLTPALKESKKASPKGLPYAGEKKKS